MCESEIKKDNKKKVDISEAFGLLNEKNNTSRDVSGQDLLDMLRQRRANKVKSEMYENKIKNDNVNLVDTSEALASLKAEKNTGGDMSGQDLLAKLRQSRADKTNK